MRKLGLCPCSRPGFKWRLHTPVCKFCYEIEKRNLRHFPELLNQNRINRAAEKIKKELARIRNFGKFTDDESVLS